jgi:transcriptional regulator with XRE-family HTH domain
MTKQTFASMMREARRQRKVTQADLARRIGVSTPYLCEVERAVKPAGSGIVNRIAAGLGLDPEIRAEWNRMGAELDGWSVR